MKTFLNQWNAKEEETIWQEGIFIFDSSTLLNFYEFSVDARKDIYTNIFPLLKDRLWITNQTEHEFHKHREKVANRPEALYQEIKDKYYPDKHFKVFVQQYDQLKARTAKTNRHPYLTQEIFKDFEEALAGLAKQEKLLESKLDLEIDQRLAEHTAAIEKDQLLSFFKVTPAYSYREIMEIVKEGEFRYRHGIPPGYADEKEKTGIEKFGDLIIWKQSIDLARQLKKPVLLIIDDLKADWCVTDKKDKRKLVSPRFELIKEMQDEGGVAFWLYDSSQFVYKAKELLKSSVNEQVIKEVSSLAIKRRDTVEDAIFAWAKKRFKADQTLWPADFRDEDTGADIIQMIDGVAFSIQIKQYSGRVRMRDLIDDINEVDSITQGSYIFEGNILVIVGETPAVASTIHEFMAEHLKNIQVYSGYIDDSNNFIELHADNRM